MVLDLLAHQAHADAAMLHAIGRHETAARDGELRGLMHHILFAHRFWIHLGQGLPFAVEKEFRAPDSLAEVEWLAGLRAPDPGRVCFPKYSPEPPRNGRTASSSPTTSASVRQRPTYWWQAAFRTCTSVPYGCPSVLPLYTYGPDGTHRRDNITGWALERSRTYYGNPRITRCRIFHYVYGILHQAGYRERFAQNLKLALPRIPFAPDFDAFAYAGEELARLHLDYEKLEPYPRRFIETPGAVLRYEVHDKMRLARDRASLAVNPTLTLAGIPHEAFDYRLGNRSAIEWVVDQYEVTEDPRSGIRSDPNRPEDPQYIVRLAGQVIRLSLETVRIVKNLPAAWS